MIKFALVVVSWPLGPKRALVLLYQIFVVMGPQRSLDLSLVSISLCAKFQTFSSILSGRFW